MSGGGFGFCDMEMEIVVVDGRMDGWMVLSGIGVVRVVRRVGIFGRGGEVVFGWW